MTKATQISASLEDYIEAIFHIVAEKQAAKPRDLAEKLKVANSSVTGALKMLAGKALINYAPYDIITLTPAGKMYDATGGFAAASVGSMNTSKKPSWRMA